MRFEIPSIADAMIGESSLPYFSLSTLHSQSSWSRYPASLMRHDWKSCPSRS